MPKIAGTTFDTQEVSSSSRTENTNTKREVTSGSNVTGTADAILTDRSTLPYLLFFQQLLVLEQIILVVILSCMPTCHCSLQDPALVCDKNYI